MLSQTLKKNFLNMKKFNLSKKGLLQIINNIEVSDIHTHLFPQAHKKYFLSGLDELLNYHYLTTEFLSSSGFDPKRFFSLKKRKRAELVWNFLFLNNSPVSEACRGILKIMKFLKIRNYENKNYKSVLKKFNSKKYNTNEILKKLRIKKIVMTNNPFDKDEWKLFKNKNWDKNIYKSSIRLDDLFNSNIKYSNNELKKFILKCIKISNPSYFAVSVDGENIKKIFITNYMKKVILPILLEKKLPLMILIGVKRGINKDFKEGGDGIGNENCETLEKIVKENKGIKFLVTHLSDVPQYRLIVLSRKLSNLKLFGFWWYLNQKKMITSILDQKINLLGLNFIAQHSDARVFEQLIYKWISFKEILCDVFFEKYTQIMKEGYNISLSQIKNDMKHL